ncbi:hypothetical protein DIE21_04130 [Burkholderia sp. Bp9140]|nr:hypothetical protein DIE21_04130 [Burkholderia sp. Bp9140]
MPLAVLRSLARGAGRISPKCITSHSSDEKSPAVPGMMRTLRMNLMPRRCARRARTALCAIERFCNINSVYS